LTTVEKTGHETVTDGKVVPDTALETGTNDTVPDIAPLKPDDVKGR